MSRKMDCDYRQTGWKRSKRKRMLYRAVKLADFGVLGCLTLLRDGKMGRAWNWRSGSLTVVQGHDEKAAVGRVDPTRSAALEQLSKQMCFLSQVQSRFEGRGVSSSKRPHLTSVWLVQEIKKLEERRVEETARLYPHEQLIFLEG
jgi:hypothetical protein